MITIKINIFIKDREEHMAEKSTNTYNHVNENIYLNKSVEVSNHNNIDALSNSDKLDIKSSSKKFKEIMMEAETDNNFLVKTSLDNLFEFICSARNIIYDLIDTKNKTANIIIKKFSFTATKLQKISIIAILRYLYLVDHLINVVDDKNVDSILPINNLNSFTIENCGFGINYNKFITYSLNPFYDSDFFGDQNISLTSFFEKDEIFDKLYNNETLTNSYYLLNMPTLFKFSIIDTIIEYIYYTPKYLGQYILNPLKNVEIENNKNVSVLELFQSSKDKTNTEIYNFLNNYYE